MFALALFLLVVALAESAAESAALSRAQPWWSSPVLSFWYAPDNDWRSAVDIVHAHLPPAGSAVELSVMAYCGLDIRDDGTLVTSFHPTCAGLFPALQQLGVRTELVTNSGNCSIAAMRLLWADTAVSPRVLRDAVLLANASGVNIDFEPQGDNCRGGRRGTPRTRRSSRRGSRRCARSSRRSGLASRWTWPAGRPCWRRRPRSPPPSTAS